MSRTLWIIDRECVPLVAVERDEDGLFVVTGVATPLALRSRHGVFTKDGCTYRPATAAEILEVLLPLDGAQ